MAGGTMITTRTQSAALLLGNLVPGAVNQTDGMLRHLEPDEYRRLSSGQRAAYEIALDLWDGNGPFSRYVAFGDMQYAGVLVGAITVALGDRIVPVDEGVRVHGR